ncbi:hypothetical protein Anas_02913, partial [Armadillidium nasatum]
NIIRAMLTSCTIITLVYLATNASYFILLSKSEFLSSDAVAVEFAENISVSTVDCTLSSLLLLRYLDQQWEDRLYGI